VFTVSSSTSNLAFTGMTVSNNGGDAGPPFDEEAAGSLQFNGVFTQLQFMIINSAPDASGNDDRRGFVITSVNAPVVIPEPSSGVLAVIGLGLFGRRRRN